MSDLAKFVAATLQERVAVDLEEENKALRKKNEKLQAMLEAERTKALEYASQNGRVEITGKDVLEEHSREAAWAS
jgi:histone H3/H4